jgi:hypothetical protein
MPHIGSVFERGGQNNITKFSNIILHTVIELWKVGPSKFFHNQREKSDNDFYDL